MLQFLIHLVRHTKVMLEMRRGDWVLPVFRVLHRLFQRCMYHADEVPCQWHGCALHVLSRPWTLAACDVRCWPLFELVLTPRGL